jgi:ribonuclease G
VLAAGDRTYIQTLALPVKEGQVLTVEVVEAHLNNPLDGIARLEGYIIDIENGGALVGKKVKVRIGKMYKTYAKAAISE